MQGRYRTNKQFINLGPMLTLFLVQGMYANARSRVRVGEGFSKEFEVKVGVHKGSVLSSLLFIIMLEALSRDFLADVPLEDLYADDLVIIVCLICLFDLIVYIPATIFQLNRVGSSWVEPVLR